MSNETLTYTATCLFGLEGLLGQEIDALGYKRVYTMDGRITFEGDAYACCACNINLRFAERLYLNLGEFEACTFDELFEGTRRLPWERWIGKNDCFPVRGHALRSTLFSVPDCQRIIKKAVAKRLGVAYGLETLPEAGVKYQIDFFIFKDRASLMIDLSGVPLHKRGYRPQSVAAPLRETLAAALVKLSRPREAVLLRDPFCGSGTIAVEGAMMMKNIAPGLNRTFCSEDFPQFPPELWSWAREAAREAVITDSAFRAAASDIDGECIEIAKAAARRAGVADSIDFFVADALKLETGGVRGTVVTNPPYGERLMRGEAEELYRNMGKVWQNLDRWQIYVLTSHPDFQRLYGRRADKVRKLYNGMIPCNYYQFFKNK
ncbi:MAG: class I SAM-dependent RNA methyltransferase [Candidatus Avispirillum sp.]